MKLSLSCRALLWSAPGRDFLSDRGVVDATTLARLPVAIASELFTQRVIHNELNKVLKIYLQVHEHNLILPSFLPILQELLQIPKRIK